MNASCGLRVAGCGLRVAGCGLRVARLRVARLRRVILRKHSMHNLAFQTETKLLNELDICESFWLTRIL